MQKAQATLVAHHTGGREELLLGRSDVASELREWPLGCDPAALYKTLALATPLPLRATRIAVDGELSAHAENTHTHKPHTNIRSVPTRTNASSCICYADAKAHARQASRATPTARR
jgi:hypothetical protein